MKRVWIGIISGILLGLFDVAMIYPMPFPNKELVLLGAFSNRFAIGLFSAAAQLGVPLWLQGIIVGLIISILPSVNNPGYTTVILGTGALGGLLSGFATAKLTAKKKR